MSITCRNPKVGAVHQHETAKESRLCWFPPAQPVVASAPTVRMATPKQVAFLESKGHKGPWTFDEAHAKISEIINSDSGKKSAVSQDPRFRLINSMIDLIPEGYYATAPSGENREVDFVRIVTMKSKASRYNGSLVVQTQHSDAWEVRLVRWKGSGEWSVYQHAAIDFVMEILADYKTCGMRYSIMLQRCMRCGKQLTDERSRHYLVGPECETKYNFIWPIVVADDLNGRTFEELRNLSLPYNQHHEKLRTVA